MLKFLEVDEKYIIDLKKLNTSEIKNSGRLPKSQTFMSFLDFFNRKRHILNSFFHIGQFKLGDTVYNFINEKLDIFVTKKAPSKKAAKFIIDNLYPDICKLEKLIKIDLSDWYRDYRN